MKHGLWFLLFFYQLTSADIYQTIDKKGNLLFSDRPLLAAKRFQLPRDVIDEKTDSIKNLFDKIKTLTVEIETLEKRITHFALNDYEEAILKVRLERMRDQLKQLQNKANQDLNGQLTFGDNSVTYQLFMTQKTIAQLQEAIEVARENHESTKFFEKRLKQEELALKQIQLHLMGSN